MEDLFINNNNIDSPSCEYIQSFDDNVYPTFLEQQLLYVETRSCGTNTDNILNFSKYHNGKLSETTFNNIKTIIDNIDFSKDYNMKELYGLTKTLITKSKKTPTKLKPRTTIYRKLTSFNIYVGQMKDIITKENPEKSKKEIMKQITHEWGKKTQKEKKQYLQ